MQSGITRISDSKNETRIPLRGDDLQQSALFSYVSPEQRVPLDHPLRKLLPLVNAALAGMSRRFTRL